MKFVALILVALGCALPVHAATGTASFALTRPTTYADNSPLPANSITGYGVECTLTPTGGTMNVCATTPASLPGGLATGGSVTFSYPPQGARACFRLRTLVGANSSELGAEVCKDLPGVKPNPPTDVTITVTLALQLSSATPITLVSVSAPSVNVSPPLER